MGAGDGLTERRQPSNSLAPRGVLRIPLLPVASVDRLSGVRTWDAARTWIDADDRAGAARRKLVEALGSVVRQPGLGRLRGHTLDSIRTLRRPASTSKHLAAIRGLDVTSSASAAMCAHAAEAALERSERAWSTLVEMAAEDQAAIRAELLRLGRSRQLLHALSGTNPRFAKELLDSGRNLSVRDLATVWAYVARSGVRSTPLGWFSAIRTSTFMLGDRSAIAGRPPGDWASLARISTTDPDEQSSLPVSAKPVSAFGDLAPEMRVAEALATARTGGAIHEVVRDQGPVGSYLTTAVVDALAAWVRATASLSWPSIERAVLAAMIDERLSPGRVIGVTDLAAAMRQLHLRGRLPEHVRWALAERDRLAVLVEAPGREVVELLVDDLPDPSSVRAHDPRSAGFHALLTPDGVSLNGGRYMRGAGSTLTAAMAVDGAVASSVRTRITSLWPDHRVLQIAPDRRFFGDGEVQVGDEMLCIEEGPGADVHVSDLVVVSGQDGLDVRTKDGERVVLLDLSPLDSAVLTPVRRLVRLLAVGTVFDLPIGPSQCDHAVVNHLPSVVLEGSVELRREVWRVPPSALAGTTETDVRFIAGVARFAAEHGIPPFVFARLRGVRDLVSPSPFGSHTTRFAEGSLLAWIRPRPLDLSNPWSVHILRRAAKRAHQFGGLVFELSPRVQAVMLHGHAAEAVFEIDLHP